MVDVISRSAEYAIRALACLSQSPAHPLTSPHLAAAASVSPAYLKKVLHQLGRARLVRGRRGAGGGFVLGVPANQLTVQRVVRAVETARPQSRGAHGTWGVGRNGRPSRWPLTGVLSRIQGLLAATTIEDLSFGCAEEASRVACASRRMKRQSGGI